MTLKSEIAKLLKASKNELATIVGKDGIVGEDMEFIDTGSYILNAMLSASIFGGLPNNLITVLSGNESVGKTYMAIQMAKNFQDKYDGGTIAYFESEHALMTKMLIDRGIDIDRWLHHPVATVEGFRTQCTKILNDYKDVEEMKLMVVLDSLGNLSTNKEIGDILAGDEKRDMTRAALIKGAFRVLALELGNLGVPMIVTNHVYDTMAAYSAKQQSGGSGVRYGADTIIEISKAQQKDDKTKTVVGNILTFKNTKSRLTREKSIVKSRLFYESGLDRYYGLIDLGALGGLFKKSGNKWQWPDGSIEFEKVIYDNPAKYFTSDILLELDTIAKDVFSYGSSKDLLVVEDDEEVSKT